MELIAGETLQRLSERQHGPLEWTLLASIIAQMAAALDYAHGQGVIHRDVKPSNILIERSGRAVLTDFGIARIADATRMTRTGTMIGTPEYMSPEQVVGQQIDARTDIYSLGVVLYQLATGRVPFTGDTHAVLYAHAHRAPPPPRQLNPNMPRAVESVILKALAKHPAQRYQHASELASALRAALATPSTTLAPANAKWLWAALGVVGLIVLGIVFASATTPRAGSGTTVVADTRAANTLPAESVVKANSTPTSQPVPATPFAARGTDTPAPTRAPTVTSTSAPPSPTSIPPTATRIPPTATPIPPTPTPTCGIGPGNTFRNIWSLAEVRGRLGCASSGESTIAVAEQAFQKGQMLWRGDTRMILVLFSDSSWAQYTDTWFDGQNPESCQFAPPAGLLRPTRGFGKVWCLQPGVRDNISWGLELEGAFNDPIQDFQNGLIYRSSRFGATFVLYGDGRWERR